MSQSPEYIFWPVCSLVDAELMRQIRNTVRDKMTNNQDYISQDQQIEWYENLSRHVWPYLLWLNDTAIGYGLISVKEDPWLTGGILPEYQGQGAGRYLFECLIETAEKEFGKPKLSVWSNNHKAIKLYTSLGFVKTHEIDTFRGRVAFMIK